MDLRRALVTAVYEHLTEDATLKALFKLPGEGVGTVRLIDGMAQPDTKFPYLTHRLTLETGSILGLGRGRLVPRSLGPFAEY